MRQHRNSATQPISNQQAKTQRANTTQGASVATRYPGRCHNGKESESGSSSQPVQLGVPADRTKRATQDTRSTVVSTKLLGAEVRSRPNPQQNPGGR
eukprot:IDg21724t1